VRLVAFAAVALASSGCSSGSDDASRAPGSLHDASAVPGTDGAATGVDGGADPTPAESCTHPGDKGNAIGVGEYCTPVGGECKAFDGAPFCLASAGQTQWFCSRVGCTKDDQCGMGAFCLFNPAGSACVPYRCVSDAGASHGPADAGTD
jgi:hypothetical protein